MSRLRFRLIALLAIATVALTASNAHSGNTLFPISGSSHNHSTFSDGTKTIHDLAIVAQYLGFDYVIMSDHADDIEATSRDKVMRAFSSNNIIEAFMNVAGSSHKEHGIENYINTCRKESQATGVLMVPGLEVELGGDRDQVYDPQNSNNRCHMLVVGYMTPEIFSEIMDCVAERKEMGQVQDEVGAIAHRYGCAAIIAHPFAGDPMRPGWYTFYKNHVDNIDAVECFNVSTQKTKEAMGLINRDELQGPFKPISAIAGSDFHGLYPDEIKNFASRVSILMPDTELTGNFASDCRAVARAIRRYPIHAINGERSRSEIGQSLLRECDVYANEKLITTHGLQDFDNKGEVLISAEPTLSFIEDDVIFVSGINDTNSESYQNQQTQDGLVAKMLESSTYLPKIEQVLNDSRSTLFPGRRRGSTIDNPIPGVWIDTTDIDELPRR